MAKSVKTREGEEGRPRHTLSERWGHRSPRAGVQELMGWLLEPVPPSSTWEGPKDRTQERALLFGDLCHHSTSHKEQGDMTLSLRGQEKEL